MIDQNWTWEYDRSVTGSYDARGILSRIGRNIDAEFHTTNDGTIEYMVPSEGGYVCRLRARYVGLSSTGESQYEIERRTIAAPASEPEKPVTSELDALRAEVAELNARLEGYKSEVAGLRRTLDRSDANTARLQQQRNTAHDALDAIVNCNPRNLSLFLSEHYAKGYSAALEHVKAIAQTALNSIAGK